MFKWLAVVAFLLFLPSLAKAQCVVTATDMDFGQVNLITTSQPTATSTMTVTCTYSGLLAAYRVCINLGAGTGASGTTRRMQNGSNTLTYNLYSNSARTTSWGSRLQSGFGNPVSLDLTPLLGFPASQTLTVYGRSPRHNPRPQAGFTHQAMQEPMPPTTTFSHRDLPIARRFPATRARHPLPCGQMSTGPAPSPRR